MEDINISSVDFGSSLPKWATDETLKRLYKIIQNDSARDKKESQKIISLLGKIATESKASSTTDKSILAELKAIRAIHKSNSTTLSKLQNKSTNTGTAQSNKQLERLLQNTNKTLQQISSNTAKAAKSNNSTQPKQTKQGSGDSSTNNNKSGSISSPINTIGDKLKGKLGRGSIEDRIEDSLSRKSKIGANLENILNKAGNNFGTNLIGAGKIAKGFGLKTASMGLGFAKMLPVIGTVITALSSVAAIFTVVAEQTKKYAWDSHREVKGMLKSGFSFGIETIEQGIKMDGIKLHGLINRSGMTIADGMAVMEKNAVLMNNLGIGNVFDTVKNVADFTTESNRSFQDQLLLSRQEIGEFTVQYLASTMNIIKTEKQREEDRAKAARNYIQDARLFGQVTGQGMQVIIDKMNELRKTDDYRLAVASRSKEGAQLLETGATFFSSLNLNSSLTDMLLKASMDTRGIGLAAADNGAEIRNAISALVGVEGSNKLDEIVRGIQTSTFTPEQLRNELANLSDMFSEDVLKMNKEQAKVYLAMGTTEQKAAASMIMALQQTDGNAIRNGVGGTDADRTSNLLNIQQETESTIAATKAVLEGVAINTADTEGARNAMTGILEVMKTSIEAGGTVMESLLKGVLEGVMSLINIVTNGFRSLTKMWPFGGSDDNDDVKTPLDNNLSKIMGTLKGESTVDRNTLYDRISQATGLQVKDSFFGLSKSFDHSDETFNKLNEHANNLVNGVLSGNKESLTEIRNIISNTDIHDAHRKVYEDVMRNRMETSGDNGKQIMDTFTKMTTTVSKIPEVITSIPKELVPKPINTSQIQETINIQKEKVDAIVGNAMENIKQNNQQTNEITTPPVPFDITQSPQANVIIKEENTQLISGINTLISKVEDLTRLQKEFNNNMVIQIIKA